MTINAAGCDGQRNSHVCTHSTICSRLTLQLLRQEVHRVFLTGTLTHLRCHEFGRFGRFRSLVPATRGRLSRDCQPVPNHPELGETETSRRTLSALSDAAGITGPLRVIFRSARADGIFCSRHDARRPVAPVPDQASPLMKRNESVNWICVNQTRWSG